MEAFDLANIPDDEWESMSLGQKLARLDPEVVREVFLEAIKKDGESPLLRLISDGES